jgi:anti-sigma factor (TIGR02949 family)
MEPGTAFATYATEPEENILMTTSMRPSITCADAMRRLWEYLDRALPALEEHELRRHLAECAGCRNHAAFERRLLEEIAAVRPEHDALLALRNRIAAALAKEGGPRNPDDA